MTETSTASFGLVAPVAVFDSGLGSLTIVKALRERVPSADIIYFADRANFPYGRRTLEALRSITTRSVVELARLGARHVVVGSNTPSGTVLDDVEADLRPGHPDVRILGVRPPVSEACTEAASEAGSVVVLGSHTLVNSAALKRHFARCADGQVARCRAVDAGDLIDLVESGDFLDRPSRAAEVVERFVRERLAGGVGIGVVTLSSTHLGWLASHLRDALPRATILDPLDSIVTTIASALQPGGTGRTATIATAVPGQGANDTSSDAAGSDGEDRDDIDRFAGLLGRLGVPGLLHSARWVTAPGSLTRRLEVSSTPQTIPRPGGG